jgi:malonyl CoA-acyl carrier protein transacylase
MTCWMFPGQPIAFDGMPHDDGDFQEIARLCRDTTGFNPLDDGKDVSGLSESVRLQLYGTCVSLLRNSQLTLQGRLPELIAEHSMGIYPALAAAGSIDNATALALTGRIGVAMAQMGRLQEYALGSVIGLPVEALETITAGNGVHIANHNTSRHFLLAGERMRVEAALREAEACGAFSARAFPCDAPLHTPLIAEIAPELQRIVADYCYHEPRIPIIEHIGQTTLTAARIPGFLVDELHCPVYWGATYRYLCSQGVTRFQEVGVGSALAKFNRWIDSEQ